MTGRESRANTPDIRDAAESLAMDCKATALDLDDILNLLVFLVNRDGSDKLKDIMIKLADYPIDDDEVPF